MTSTVTTSTVASLTSASSAVFFASMGLIVAILLLTLIIQKEIFTSSSNPYAKSISRILNAAILPLGIAFGVSGLINVIGLMA